MRRRRTTGDERLDVDYRESIRGAIKGLSGDFYGRKEKLRHASIGYLRFAVMVLDGAILVHGGHVIVRDLYTPCD